ncbi:MAG: TRAP transporter large permease [Desulfomicrobium sp.]|uniref:TRAP transporter large permease n=1 Tax=Hoeflea sp. TaxID=1940281 RepID=UPI0025BE7B7A|nr:TRAP transporter large permease [Hoeflea sp.]MBU4529366.1 TRAP transporter large permease [Alphaproteobacteria bacterium]MBV1712682.1 TRAP transporter large permease [Desulfomicrobium sp.]MBU4545037.1 TRAP transporter large permease [Alphaproteobacteria bacterium]MBU4552444.1 TRAP transporter large permease [Alphaproteobacteria bacterium]MBV1783595.1 TRAP transporter large permease [Hoeflea sp.]
MFPVALTASMLVFFTCAVPIAITLGMVSAMTMYGSGIPLQAMIQRMFAALDSFPLTAIPFFILAGALMEVSGISTRLVNFAQSLVGRATGGLGLVAVLSAMFFAAISGSSAATTAAIGGILIPAMAARGYSRPFATSVQASSGELGVIIPPSIPMIIFALTAGVPVSIGDLFLAGILPGLLVAGGLMLTVYLVSKRKGYGRAKPGAAGDGLSPQPGVWESFKAAILPLMLPVLILGGIYGGIFTPTEAAAAAVCFALIIGVVVFRTITVEKLLTALRSSLLNTVVILLIISAASVFGWVLTANRIPELISQVFVSISDNPLVFLLLINLLLLLVGMFLETGAAITVLAPILTPVALKMGIDPIHFGIVMIVNLAVGMTTPPVGVNLFVACQVAGLRIEHIIRSMLPFYLSLLICLAIITYLPGVSLWLPQLLK